MNIPSFFRTLTRPQITYIILEACIILSLGAAVVGERSIIAAQRKIMPAGDVFNFQSIARNIRHFDYPLHEKRLPGFPLTLLIGTEMGFDPTITGVVVSILASAGITVVLYLLGRHFRWPRFPLAVVLLLTSVAPLLTINGIRPLADSYFLFWIVLSVYMVTAARATKVWAIWTGIVLMLMVFTRYEGGPTAVLLLLLLRFKMSWRLVGLAALPLIIAGILWAPVLKYVNGSLNEFGYAQDAKANASIATLPSDYMKIVESSGFGKAWTITDLWSDDKQIKEEATSLFVAPEWWLSVLASFGFFWIIFSLKKESAPLVVAFILYPVIPAWWFTYSRYVAPMSAFYFFCMAAGVVGVWQITMWLLRRTDSSLKIASTVLLSFFLIYAVIDVAPVFYKEAVAKGLENNGRGYSLYVALQSLRNRPERVAISFDYLMASMMFGNVDSPKDALNTGRGVYLSSRQNATPAEMAAYLKEKQVDIIVDNGEKEVISVVSYLKARNEIDHTETYLWPRQDKEIDTTHLHYLK